MCVCVSVCVHVCVGVGVSGNCVCSFSTCVSVHAVNACGVDASVYSLGIVELSSLKCCELPVHRMRTPRR